MRIDLKYAFVTAALVFPTLAFAETGGAVGGAVAGGAAVPSLAVRLRQLWARASAVWLVVQPPDRTRRISRLSTEDVGTTGTTGCSTTTQQKTNEVTGSTTTKQQTNC